MTVWIWERIGDIQERLPLLADMPSDRQRDAMEGVVRRLGVRERQGRKWVESERYAGIRRTLRESLMDISETKGCGSREKVSRSFLVFILLVEMSGGRLGVW